jgi:hypothetical protein
MGTGSFSEINRLVRGADHPPPSSAKVRKRRAILLLYFWAFIDRSRVSFIVYLYRISAL